MLKLLEYSGLTTVGLCILLSGACILSARSEPRPGSSGMLAIAFALLALMRVLYSILPGVLASSLLYTVITNASAALAMGFLWYGITLRAGRHGDHRIFAALALFWVGAILLLKWLDVDARIRVLTVCMIIFVGMSITIYRLLNKQGEKNAGDRLLIVWLTAVVFVPVAASLIALGSVGTDGHATWSFYLQLMPIMITGIGLFSIQSYALDALNEMERRARTDPLTGALNRRAFDEELTIALARAKRYERSLALVTTDIDHFKRINDRFGHPTGDEVIKRFASMLREESREVDTVARIGGEEFAVVVPEIDVAQATAFAERLRQATEKIQIGDLTLTASFGVASTDFSDYVGRTLIRNADMALYKAKEQGRNRVESSTWVKPVAHGDSAVLVS